MKTEIMSVVWGENYVSQLLNFSLPSLLAPGNVPAWPWFDELSIRICTTPKDAAIIKSHPVWQDLSHLVQTYLDLLPEEEAGKNKYLRMNKAHQQAFYRMQAQEAALVMMMPDTLFCDGTFKRLGELLYNQPLDVVLCLGPRLNSETASPILYQLRYGQSLSVTPKQGLQFLLEHPHSTTQGQFWGGTKFDLLPVQIYYWSDNGQLIVQTLNPHPVIFTHTYQSYEPRESEIDGAFLQQFDAKRQRVHLIRDEQVLLLSLTPSKDMQENILQSPQPLNRKQILLDRFHRHWNKPIHHWFFDQPIVLTPSLEMRQPAQPEIKQALQAVQWFWHLEAAFHHHDQAAIAHLRTEHQLLAFLPDVLQQAAHWYCQGEVTPNSPSFLATMPDTATLHQNQV